MNVTELARAIQSLNHFLIDVWDWDALEAFRKEYVQMVIDVESEHQDALSSERSLNGRLRAHLTVKYNEAVTVLDRIAEDLKEAPDFITDALLERVGIDITRLQGANDCERQWRDHQPFSPQDYFDEPTEEELEEYLNRPPQWEWSEDYPDRTEPWTYIATELGHFAEKVVQRIEQHRKRTTTAGDMNIRPTTRQRPQWKGSASELAYLLTELIERNHIIPPPLGKKVGKDGNRAAVAEAVYDGFDIRNPATGEPVTREYFKSLLKKESPDRGTFPEFFKIGQRPL